MNAIHLTDVMPIPNPERYKLHLGARNSEGVHPLNEYVKDSGLWRGWNEWKDPRKNDWTREFIFSLVEYYPISHAWLFGGVFRVLDRREDRYELEAVCDFTKFEGRLICGFYRYQGLRGRAFYLESHIESINVLQILPHRFDGEAFVGYENIDHGFDVLKAYIAQGKQDWKASLAAVKGVYLVVDTATGKSYVGSAYGSAGIWSRLDSYVNTGHGWNDGLVETINQKGLEYALKHFKFSVLEIFTYTTADEVILRREAHWKRVLLSREFGYNRN